MENKIDELSRFKCYTSREYTARKSNYSLVEIGKHEETQAVGWFLLC